MLEVTVCYVKYLFYEGYYSFWDVTQFNFVDMYQNIRREITIPVILFLEDGGGRSLKKC
jgi:hypothetical protein